MGDGRAGGWKGTNHLEGPEKQGKADFPDFPARAPHVAKRKEASPFDVGILPVPTDLDLAPPILSEENIKNISSSNA